MEKIRVYLYTTEIAGQVIESLRASADWFHAMKIREQRRFPSKLYNRDFRWFNKINYEEENPFIEVPARFNLREIETYSDLDDLTLKAVIEYRPNYAAKRELGEYVLGGAKAELRMFDNQYQLRIEGRYLISIDAMLALDKELWAGSIAPVSSYEVAQIGGPSFPNASLN